MYADFSIQRIKRIEAKAFVDLQSTPLIIGFESVEDVGYAHGQITLHLEDAALAAALVEAINSTVAKHAAKTEWVTDETGLIDTNIITGEQRA